MFKSDEIYEDKYIQKIYDGIEEYEKNDFATHGRKHIYKVTKIIETILTKLNYSEDIIECGKIAALLHDLGCMQGKKEHEIRSYNIAKQYLKDKQLTKKQKEVILNAIINHRNVKEEMDILERALVVSDKLDYTKNRLTKESLKIEGLSELQYVNEIVIDITENEFIVRFITEKEFKKELLEKYYFTEKVFKAINSFSEYINRKPVILINDIIWIFSIN
ncbi:MAG: HD domain-containing protein [Clostridiales bacterium]|nr:HD domain-containing protein [Clostridiales bacterium]